MAHVHGSEHTLPKKAASAVNAHCAVVSDTTAHQVVPAATSMGASQAVIGLTTATAASAGNPVPVQYLGVAKAVAAASVGVGALVGVASPNGALGPIVGVGSPLNNIVGVSQSAAAEAEIFSVLLRPETGR